MITLRQPLTLEECQQARIWRNDPAVLPMLRTGYKTEEEQAQFYQDVICNPNSEHQYYAGHTLMAAAEDDPVDAFVSMGGLTFIHDGQAEISLIVHPQARKMGLGADTVTALLDKARTMTLKRVIGECYPHGPQAFWLKCMTCGPAYEMWSDDAGTLHWTWWL